MCGLLAVPCSGLLCGLGKETASPALLAGADTALSSGALSPNGKAEGELEPFCVDFREPQLGRDGLDISVSVRNRDKLAAGTPLSPLVLGCHSVTSCLFSSGGLRAWASLFLSEDLFHRLYPVLLSVQQIGSAEVIMPGLGWNYWGRECIEMRETQCSQRGNQSSPHQVPSVSYWDAQGL